MTVTALLINKKLMTFIVGILFPVIFLGYWLFTNTQLPVEDAANYLSTAVTVHSSFMDSGILGGIKSIYMARGWRPIFYPILLVPFLLATQGKLLLAYSLFSVSILALSLAYVYFYLRLKVEHYAAVLACSFIGLLPTVQNQVIMMFAESGLFVCVLGSIYHLIRSDYLRIKSHTIGFVVLMILGFLIRPVEMVIHLIFVLSLFVVSGYRKKIFTAKQVKTIAIATFAYFFVFLVCIARHYFGTKVMPVVDGGGHFDKKMATFVLHLFRYSVALGALLVGIYLFKRSGEIYHYFSRAIKKAEVETLIVPAIFAILSVVFLWYFWFAMQTFEWIYRTSFGDVAINTGDLTHAKSLLGKLQQQIQAEGQFAVIGVVLLALIAFIAVPKKEIKNILSSDVFLYLLMVVPLPLLEVLFTVQSTPRKLSVAFPCFLIAMLILGLQAGRFYLGRVMMMLALMLGQFVLLFLLLQSPSHSSPNILLNRLVGYLIPAPIKVMPNPHNVLVDYLQQMAIKYDLHNIAIQVDPRPRVSTFANPVDPFLISTMVEAKRINVAASYPYFSTYSDGNIKSLNKRFDAIFLSDVLDDMNISHVAASSYKKKYESVADASIKTFYKFLYEYSKNNTEAYGWKLGPCLTLESADHRQFNGCLLLAKK